MYRKNICLSCAIFYCLFYTGSHSGDEIMKKEFAERVVIVTGATSGIGRAVSARFAEASARVVAVGRNQKALDEVSRAIKGGGGESLSVTADVTSEPGAQR